MKHLDYSLEETLTWWDETDQRGKFLPGVRALCQTDRYYLLVKAMRRHGALHPWIYARCREVEKSPTGHLDLWAREHWKSSIITMAGAIQRILNDPEITICILGHSNVIAEPFLRNLKTELEHNVVLKTAFPDILYSDPQKEALQWSNSGITVKRLGNPKECTVECSGLDSQPIGKHYQLRIYDDAVVPESVSTPEQVQKSIANYSMSQSLGTEGGEEWMIGTRYSYADLYDWVLTRGALIPRIYPATDDGTPEGRPVLFSDEEWAARKLKLTVNDLSCQYMQNPLSGENRMFDVEDLQTYEVRPETLAVYIMVDPARSKKRDSANTAMAVVGVDYALNKYLLDGFNHKMNLKERWENLASLYLRWKHAPGVQIIKVGYESFGAQADIDYFEEQMKMPNRPRFEVIELTWPRDGEGSKTDRVQRLVPDMKSHKIFLPYETDEQRPTRVQRDMAAQGYDYRVSRTIRRKDENGRAYDLSEALRGQMFYFPFGKLKDLVDALSRIYDMEVKAPQFNQARYAEPEVV